MRAAIYARFSSDLQSDRSIDDQVALCRDIARRNSCDVVATYEDREISGASAINRPGFRALMQAAAEGAFEAIVIEDIDRFARDQADWHAARKRLDFLGVKLFTALGAVGKLDGSLRALMAEHFIENLVVHIRRGMAGRVRQGFAAGGLTYGYDVVPGDKGSRGGRTINEAEAAVVRRIFAEYVEGKTPRAIVVALNDEGVRPPRGCDWRPSVLLGNPKRGYGILRNPLYDGRLVWNRVRMVKDPDTGKRVSRTNPSSEWQVTKVEDLRIIDAMTFNAAQARHASRSQSHPTSHRRVKHLLSGLLKCGSCGATMVVKDRHKKAGPRIVCSRAHDGAVCDHRRNYYLNDIERRVLSGLRAQLGEPRRIELFVAEYQAERKRLAANSARAERQRERRIAELTRSIERALDELLQGVGTDVLRARINGMDAERKRLIAERPQPVANIVALHPAAMRRYIATVDDLAAAMHRGDFAPDGPTSLALRELIDHIDISPVRDENGAYGAPDVTVSGRLALLTTAPLFPAGKVAGGIDGSGGGT